MSEQAPNKEQHTQPESAEDSLRYEKIEKDAKNKAEKAKGEVTPESLKILSETAEQQAEASDALQTDHVDDAEPESALGEHQLLKSSAYDQTLRRVQQRLPKSVQVFSKIAHNKTVDAASDIGAHTVGRPSGLLGGSLCAFLGSLILLYYSKHYGFRYNYGLFILLFVGGFLIGLTAELAIWYLYSRNHKQY